MFLATEVLWDVTRVCASSACFLLSSLISGWWHHLSSLGVGVRPEELLRETCSHFSALIFSHQVKQSPFMSWTPARSYLQLLKLTVSEIVPAWPANHLRTMFPSARCHEWCQKEWVNVLDMFLWSSFGSRELSNWLWESFVWENKNVSWSKDCCLEVWGVDLLNSSCVCVFDLYKVRRCFQTSHTFNCFNLSGTMKKTECFSNCCPLNTRDVDF